MNRTLFPAGLLAAVFLLPHALFAQATKFVPSVRDNTVFGESGLLSNGAGPVIVVGSTNNLSARRGLVMFDVAGMIPAGSSIVSATLRMTATRTQALGKAIDLHRLTASWGEGTSSSTNGQGAPASPGDATWTHRFFNTMTWSTNGGDYSAAISGTTTVQLGAMSWTAPGMVADVQSWLDNPSANHGWIMLGDETSASATLLASREGAALPMLTVTYHGPASVTSTGTGCGPVGPLTMSTIGLPKLGNASFAILVSGGSPGNPVWIYLANGLAVAPTPLPLGCNLYLDLPSAVALILAQLSPSGPFLLDGAGSLTLPLPIPNNPSLLGASIHMQTFMPRPPNLLYFSNALGLRAGR